MRVVFVIVAMLFCMTGCSRNEIQKDLGPGLSEERQQKPPPPNKTRL